MSAPTAGAGDPYVLDPAKIKEPPKGWGPSLRFLGPGMIVSAAVVGSGELITATTLGARAGFVLLWLVFVSTFVKVAVQIELARWSISTGQAAIAGYDRVPPRIGGRSWASYLALLGFLQVLTSQAGVLGAAALALGILVPVGGDSASTASLAFWVAVMVVIAIAIHIANRYEIVEKVSTVLVGLVTFAVVGLVLAIGATPFAPSWGDVGSGLTFQVAAGTFGVALAMFGITGVGAGEITSYSFWCVEKGYAAWSGPNDGSEEWVRRARGWITVMKRDAWVAWVVYTLPTAAFYFLGAAVLNPQGLEPSGNDVIKTISRIFTDTVGAWAGPVFLVFAALTLFKTVLSNVPAMSRQTANSLAVFGAFDWRDATVRSRYVRTLIVTLPILWGLLGVLVGSALTLIIISGILNALYLLVVAVATVYLWNSETDPRIKDGPAFTVFLLLSAAAILAVGFVSIYNIL